MLFFLLFLYKTYINTPKMLLLFIFLYKTDTNTSKMSNNFDICIHFQQIPAYTACTLCVTHKRGTKTLRTSFSATVELLLIRSSRVFIIFDFQQLLLMTNFDQTQGYGDHIIFGDTFDRVILLVTLFHRSIDRAILLVTLFDPSQFGDTFSSID